MANDLFQPMACFQPIDVLAYDLFQQNETCKHINIKQDPTSLTQHAIMSPQLCHKQYNEKSQLNQRTDKTTLRVIQKSATHTT